LPQNTFPQTTKREKRRTKKKVKKEKGNLMGEKRAGPKSRTLLVTINGERGRKKSLRGHTWPSAREKCSDLVEGYLSLFFEI